MCTNRSAARIEKTVERLSGGWSTTGSTDLQFGSVLAELSGLHYDADNRGSALFFLQNWLKTREGLPRILDAGCGDGAFLNLCLLTFAEAGYANMEQYVTGINLVREEYDAGTLPLSCRLTGNMDGMTADPLLWAEVKERGPFDIILAQCCLEHLADPLGFILNSLKNLRPGGLFVAGPVAYALPRSWGATESKCRPCVSIQGYDNYSGMLKLVEVLNSGGRVVASSRLWTLGVRNYTDEVGGIQQIFPLEHALLPNAKYKFKHGCLPKEAGDGSLGQGR